MPCYLELTADERLIPFKDTSDFSSRVAHLDLVMDRRQDADGAWRTTRHTTSLKMVQDHFEHQIGDLRNQFRADSGFSAGLGMFNPRDLTHRMRRVLEEKLRPLSADRIFPIDREVPPGALNYEQSRIYGSGQAQVYRGGLGEDVGTVSLGQTSFTQPIVWLISRFQVDFLEALRANQTGIDTQARKMARARRVMAEKRNLWAWEGGQSYGLYGMLNHPYIDTAVSQVAYNGDSAPDDIIDDFNFWASYSHRESGTASRPDTVVMAPDTYTYLATTPRSATSDTTILEFLQKGNRHITNWEEAPELKDALSTDVHGMVFMRRGNGGTFDSSCALVDAMPATLLAPNRQALGSDFFMVQAFGGLNHTDPDEELVVYVTGRST